MIIVSTGDVTCAQCSGVTALGLLEIRDSAAFTCGHCGTQSGIEVTKYAHDIAMYEWARRQFGGGWAAPD